MCVPYHSTLGWPPRHRLRISVCLETAANTSDFPTGTLFFPTWTPGNNLCESMSHLLHLASQPRFHPVVFFSITFAFEAGVHDAALAGLQILCRAGRPWTGITCLTLWVLRLQLPCCSASPYLYFSLLFTYSWGGGVDLSALLFEVNSAELSTLNYQTMLGFPVWQHQQLVWNAIPPCPWQKL